MLLARPCRLWMALVTTSVLSRTSLVVVATLCSQARFPGAKVDLDELSGSPRLILNIHGFLPGPDSEGEILNPRTVGLKSANG